MERVHPAHSKLGWIDLALVVMVSIWGINAVVVKLVYTQIAPPAFMAVRFAIPAVVFAVIVCMTDRHLSLTRRDWGMLALTGLVGTAMYQPFFLFGLEHTNVSSASLLIATTPAFVAILNRLLGREKLARRGWLGIALAFAGISLIVTSSGDLKLGSDLLLGDALILISNLCWAGYAIMSADLMKRHPPLRVTALSIVLGTIPLVVFAIPALGSQDWSVVDGRGWSGVLFSSLGAVVVTFLIWNMAVQRIGSARTAIYQNLTPIVAIVTAAIALGEAITLAKIAGTLIVLAGVQLVRTAKVTVESTASASAEPTLSSSGCEQQTSI
jgi:drug/metabolite transporter (DMT)-like permease